MVHGMNRFAVRSMFVVACLLVAFSPVLGAPQPDWPERALQCGYPFFREPGSGSL